MISLHILQKCWNNPDVLIYIAFKKCIEIKASLGEFCWKPTNYIRKYIYFKLGMLKVCILTVDQGVDAPVPWSSSVLIGSIHVFYCSSRIKVR